MSWLRASRRSFTRSLGCLFVWLGSPAGAALLLALPLLIVAGVSGLSFAPQTDEVKYHLPVVRQFGAALPAVPIQDYRAATTPLPYLLWGAWGRLFGYGLPALRALTLLLSYAGFVATYTLMRRQGLTRPLLATLLLVFAPYVFLNSFTVYTVNVGLPFAALALIGYLDAAQGRAGWPALLWSGLAAAAAVYCRQHYLFLPAGMALAWALGCWRRRRLTWADARDAALIALPALAFAPLLIVWRGVTPPALQALQPLRLSVEHINFLAVLVGLYFAPAALAAWPALARHGWRAAWLLAGVPLYVAFAPQFRGATDALAGAEQGIIAHGLELLSERVGPLLPALAQFALWVNGVAVLAAGLLWPAERGRSADLRPAALWGMVGAFGLMLLASDYVGERFYALIWPVLLLLLYPPVSRRRALCWLWLAATAGAGVAYSILKMRGG